MSTREALIRALNEDLTTEISTIMRYTFQEDELDGHMSNELRELFTREIEDEVGHATFLTNAIVELGGEPTNAPSTSNKPVNLKKILMLDLKMECKSAANYMNHAKLAEELGETELKLKLEELSNVKAGHARELKRILKRL